MKDFDYQDGTQFRIDEEPASSSSGKSYGKGIDCWSSGWGGNIGGVWAGDWDAKGGPDWGAYWSNAWNTPGYNNWSSGWSSESAGKWIGEPNTEHDTTNPDTRYDQTSMAECESWGRIDWQDLSTNNAAFNQEEPSQKEMDTETVNPKNKKNRNRLKPQRKAKPRGKRETSEGGEAPNKRAKKKATPPTEKDNAPVPEDKKADLPHVASPTADVKLWVGESFVCVWAIFQNRK